MDVFLKFIDLVPKNLLCHHPSALSCIERVVGENNYSIGARSLLRIISILGKYKDVDLWPTREALISLFDKHAQIKDEMTLLQLDEIHSIVCYAEGIEGKKNRQASLVGHDFIRFLLDHALSLKTGKRLDPFLENKPRMLLDILEMAARNSLLQAPNLEVSIAFLCSSSLNREESVKFVLLIEELLETEIVHRLDPPILSRLAIFLADRCHLIQKKQTLLFVLRLIPDAQIDQKFLSVALLRLRESHSTFSREEKIKIVSAIVSHKFPLNKSEYVFILGLLSV